MKNAVQSWHAQVRETIGGIIAAMRRDGIPEGDIELWARTCVDSYVAAVAEVNEQANAALAGMPAEGSC